MKKIIEERKDIAFYIKMFPLKSHPQAFDKARAILCENSLKLLEDAHEKKPLPKPSCEKNLLEEHIKQAEKVGIQSVPSLILPDGRVLPGYKDAQTLIQMIAK